MVQSQPFPKCQSHRFDSFANWHHLKGCTKAKPSEADAQEDWLVVAKVSATHMFSSHNLTQAKEGDGDRQWSGRLGQGACAHGGDLDGRRVLPRTIPTGRSPREARQPAL